MSTMTAFGVSNIERVQADQARRRSNAATTKNVRALARKGVGKGGRGSWKREI